jgi:hypothetical protein
MDKKHDFWTGCRNRYYKKTKLPIRDPDDQGGWVCMLNGYCDGAPQNCPLFEDSSAKHWTNAHDHCEHNMLYHPLEMVFYCRDCDVFINTHNS